MLVPKGGIPVMQACPPPPASLPQGDRFGERAGYQDIKGFCKSATLADIEKHNFVLTPGRYVGIPDEEDDGVPFEEKMGALTTGQKESSVTRQDFVRVGNTEQ